jgi:hypothetical protein
VLPCGIECAVAHMNLVQRMWTCFSLRNLKLWGHVGPHGLRYSLHEPRVAHVDLLFLFLTEVKVVGPHRRLRIVGRCSHQKCLRATTASGWTREFGSCALRDAVLIGKVGKGKHFVLTGKVGRGKVSFSQEGGKRQRLGFHEKMGSGTLPLPPFPMKRKQESSNSPRLHFRTKHVGIPFEPQFGKWHGRQSFPAMFAKLRSP